MANAWRIGAAVLLLSLAASVGGAQETDDRPVLSVHVENFADVPASILNSAVVELTHLYKTVGVRVLWSTRPDHSDCLCTLTIHVVLTSGGMEDRMDRRPGHAPNVLGRASREAFRAYVYWPRIKSHVSRVIVSQGDALGFVMAHEVGHILLPCGGHSATGIMQESYLVHSLYTLRFTPGQAAAIRAFLLDASKVQFNNGATCPRAFSAAF
jgi:hypothetical protein